MHYTIYKVTNQINGKLYIGSHKTKDLNDNYMGSGKYLKHAQEKYGIENFKKEILFVFDTPEEMYAKEAEIVNADFLAEENTYNLKIGGHGGFDYINSNEDVLNSEKRKEGLRNGGLSSIAKMKENNTFSAWQNLAKEKRPKEHKFSQAFLDARVKFHSDETKRKIGKTNSVLQKGEKNSQFGTMWINDGVNSMKIKKNEAIPEGYIKGRAKSNI